jgi:hypothetical protein
MNRKLSNPETFVGFWYLRNFESENNLSFETLSEKNSNEWIISLLEKLLNSEN